MYPCPICKQECLSQVGTVINRMDGVSMWCENKTCPNTADGHGKNEKEAYSVIIQKCSKSTGKE